jgi:predicted alpha/beta-fold hydrolase
LNKTTRTPFLPPRLLRSAHVQTLLGSRGRQYWVNRRAADLLHASTRELVSCSDGVQLETWCARQPGNAATVILIHGWLGHAGSSYVLSAGAQLWQRGFSVIRLNLRDHGGTAHLNEGLYNAARIAEVVEAITVLQQQQATGPCGLAGFSLGGNFALRVARELQIPTIAVCPALDPASTMARIDLGWVGYKLFFIRKWQRHMREKQLAFPHLYQFDRAMQIRSVRELTELFVNEYSQFADTAEYLSAYTLTGTALADTAATIIYAEDDPVIPAADFARLPASIDLQASRYGGHCAFVTSPARASWMDFYLADRFSEFLRPSTHEPSESAPHHRFAHP